MGHGWARCVGASKMPAHMRRARRATCASSSAGASCLFPIAPLIQCLTKRTCTTSLLRIGRWKGARHPQTCRRARPPRPDPPQGGPEARLPSSGAARAATRDDAGDRAQELRAAGAPSRGPGVERRRWIAQIIFYGLRMIIGSDAREPQAPQAHFLRACRLVSWCAGSTRTPRPGPCPRRPRPQHRRPGMRSCHVTPHFPFLAAATCMTALPSPAAADCSSPPACQGGRVGHERSRVRAGRRESPQTLPALGRRRPHAGRSHAEPAPRALRLQGLRCRARPAPSRRPRPCTRQRPTPPRSRAPGLMRAAGPRPWRPCEGAPAEGHPTLRRPAHTPHPGRARARPPPTQLRPDGPSTHAPRGPGPFPPSRRRSPQT
jgi:hypothetical protein